MIWLEKLIFPLPASPPLLNRLVELCDSMADGRDSAGEGDLAHARVDRAWCT